jgi:hypothetical protein
MLNYLDTEVKFYEDKAGFTDTKLLYRYNKEVDTYIMKAAVKRLEAVFKRKIKYNK